MGLLLIGCVDTENGGVHIKLPAFIKASTSIIAVAAVDEVEHIVIMDEVHYFNDERHTQSTDIAVTLVERAAGMCLFYIEIGDAVF